MLLKCMLLLLTVACLEAKTNESTIKEYLRATYLTGYEILNQEWKIFKETYGKKYTSYKENLKRREIFAENKLLIARHNDLYEKGGTTYTLKMNQFGDKTFEEFKNYNGLNNPVAMGDIIYDGIFKPYKVPARERYSLPTEFDWRTEGAVTKVKNQEDCGCCWAFSATGAMEGYFFIQNHFLLSLSEQNLIDCSKGPYNHGCAGGKPVEAFKYIKINDGIDTELGYPYRARPQQICSFNRSVSVPSPRIYYKIQQNEDSLKRAVIMQGPVSVSINIQERTFQFYEQGVYYDINCNSNPESLNHAVLVVGYGYASFGGEYWLVKNSWGQRWGENGYIKMAKNRNNNCGIATEAIVLE